MYGVRRFLMYMNLLQFYVYGVFVRRTSGHGVWLLDCVDRGQRPVSVSGSPWTETEAREPSKENTPATNSSRRSKSSDQTKLRERERERENWLEADRRQEPVRWTHAAALPRVALSVLSSRTT